MLVKGQYPLFVTASLDPAFGNDRWAMFLWDVFHIRPRTSITGGRTTSEIRKRTISGSFEGRITYNRTIM